MKGASKVYQAKDLCNSVTQNLERKKTNHLKVNQCSTLTFSALWPTVTLFNYCPRKADNFAVCPD